MGGCNKNYTTSSMTNDETSCKIVLEYFVGGFIMRIVRIGERYSVVSDEVETYDCLPAHTYRVTYQDLNGFYLMEHPDIVVTEKVYGVHDGKVEKVIKAFSIFGRSLGIILSGDKGIGKSLFAKRLCERAIAKGLPVIIVDEAYRGVARFIESIEQECVVLFDEFDKTFKSSREEDEQAKLLSLFDGTAGGKKMYVVTCNELHGLNEYIVNRPGRFHYHFRFEYPKAEAIREYLKDKLEQQYYEEIEKVIAFTGRINLNYDCLRAIAFEINQGMPFDKAIEELNILNVDMEEYDVFLYLESGEILHRYRYRINLYDETSYFDWITLYGEHEKENLDVRYEKRHVHYDLEKRALVIPGERLSLDYDDDEEETMEKAKALYMAFVKCGEKKIHYAL